MAEAELKAEAGGRVASVDSDRRTTELLVEPDATLRNIHRNQVHRDPWPDFGAYERTTHPYALRRAAAVQWAGRARAEHGSVHQFSALCHALCEARAPAPILGALARLITDEVRHAELCARLAETYVDPDQEPRIFAWPVPKAPWKAAPKIQDGREGVLRWAAEAVLTACCIGEALSRPMLDAIAELATEATAEACARQILRDEHLHASFGWSTLGWLLGELPPSTVGELQPFLARRLGQFERSTACGIDLKELVGETMQIRRGEDPNLGTLSDRQYGMLFYATIESEILPGFDALGFDAIGAWAERSAQSR